MEKLEAVQKAFVSAHDRFLSDQVRLARRLSANPEHKLSSKQIQFRRKVLNCVPAVLLVLILGSIVGAVVTSVAIEKPIDLLSADWSFGEIGITIFSVLFLISFIAAIITSSSRATYTAAIKQAEHALKKHERVVEHLINPKSLYADKLVAEVDRFNHQVDIWNQSVTDEEHQLLIVPDECRGVGERLRLLRDKLSAVIDRWQYVRDRKNFALPKASQTSVAAGYDELLQMEAGLLTLQRLQDRQGSHQLAELTAIEAVQDELDALEHGPERRAAEDEVHGHLRAVQGGRRKQTT